MKKGWEGLAVSIAIAGVSSCGSKSPAVYEIPKPPARELCASMPLPSAKYYSLDTMPEVVALAGYSQQEFMRGSRNLDTPTPEEIAEVAAKCPSQIFDRAASVVDSVGRNSGYSGASIRVAKHIVHPG